MLDKTLPHAEFCSTVVLPTIIRQSQNSCGEAPEGQLHLTFPLYHTAPFLSREVAIKGVSKFHEKTDGFLAIFICVQRTDEQHGEHDAEACAFGAELGTYGWGVADGILRFGARVRDGDGHGFLGGKIFHNRMSKSVEGAHTSVTPSKTKVAPPVMRAWLSSRMRTVMAPPSK